MSSPINRQSPIPLYFQLKQILLANIQSGEWQPGDLIPSEVEFEQAYGLSRTTVRQTLSELVNEGLLERFRGRGTFVAKPKASHNPTAQLSITEYMRSQGRNPQWKLLGREWVSVSAEIANVLAVEPGEDLFCVSLLLTESAEPIGYHQAYLTAGAAAKLAMGDLDDDAFVDGVRQMLGVDNGKIERIFEAIPATADHADQLRIKVDQPIQRIDILYCDADSKPVNLLRASFRGDRFHYRITM